MYFSDGLTYSQKSANCQIICYLAKARGYNNYLKKLIASTISKKANSIELQIKAMLRKPSPLVTQAYKQKRLATRC